MLTCRLTFVALIVSISGLAAPVPRAADGKPDFSGIWQASGGAAADLEDHSAKWNMPAGRSVVAGGEIPWQPWAAAKKAENFANRAKLDPLGQCYIPGVPRIMYLDFPFQIFQTRNLMLMAFEWSLDYRNIYLDGTTHPDDGIDHWMGDSRGHWDGDTLVVDVAKNNDKTWFDMAGDFHSDALHVVERYRMTDSDTIQYEATIDDSKVFTKPWTITIALHRRTDRNRLYEYAVVVTALGFNAFSEDVNVTTAPTRLDIHMVEFQFGTLGDGREFQTDRMTPHKAPTSPTPRTADGKPDLTGVWYTQRIVDPGQPEMLPWAQKYFDEQAANSFRNAPGAHCLPRGITNAGALFPFRLVQTPTLLLMIFEDDIPSHRQVFLDGRGHPKDPNPMWMGHSIARWDGDTLVIDTVGFDERSWLDAQGHPHTDKMHVVERFHRIDLGHLEIEFTIDDPGAYKKPWVIKRATELDPNDDIGEYVCTENEKDVAHMK